MCLINHFYLFRCLESTALVSIWRRYVAYLEICRATSGAKQRWRLGRLPTVVFGKPLVYNTLANTKITNVTYISGQRCKLFSWKYFYTENMLVIRKCYTKLQYMKYVVQFSKLWVNLDEFSPIYEKYFVSTYINYDMIFVN